MTKREAKRKACALAADLLDIDRQKASWLLERVEHFSDADRHRIVNAMLDLVYELERRGERGVTP